MLKKERIYLTNDFTERSFSEKRTKFMKNGLKF